METGKEINLVKYVRTADIVADSLHMIETAQRQAYKVVNVILLRRNWLLGKRIAEEVMDGQERADYGAEVIQKLSKALQAHYGKGYTKTTLYRFLALLASLWVRNAAFPCNQATLGTFDFRLGSGMRISEHTRYTISIMF